MSVIDYIVLVGTLLSIALYGMWRTRSSGGLNTYLKGDDTIRWGTIGLSVMATQASAITFLSTPGKAYDDGMGFVQNYFGMPFAIIFICIFFIPIYRRLNVYTSYEYLGQRFDTKTRILGAALFLVQRGLAAGITIYAPAIVVSSLLGWNLDLTIVLVGALVIVYTVSGGTKAVSITQRYQMGVIMLGMFIAFGMIIANLPEEVSFGTALSVAGAMDKLEVVNFSFDINERYTFWSGLLGGLFLSLSYFGTDQSQVQRYLAGNSASASRFGLLFNAVVKVPMQFFILFVGVMVFVFYLFVEPPVFFNQATLEAVAETEHADALLSLESEYKEVVERRSHAVRELAQAFQSNAVGSEELEARKALAVGLEQESLQIRERVKALIKGAGEDFEAKDSDYVFITFIVNYLPQGLIGLLVAVIFAAAMSSTASELNALGSTTMVDFYSKLKRTEHDDDHYVRVSRILTAAWGLLAVTFALYANLVENLIEAVNILGSIFYGGILGIFLVAFFIKSVRGTAVFTAAIVSQLAVIGMYFVLEISYLWYNLIGCALVMGLSFLLQHSLFRENRKEEGRV
ncbi:sodium:solute symporter [Pelagicoccus sp. SDUM812003]|uniref:sodium:solute symporter n=1 Tax=Pelagicoccus sp. SDUM812003 TaxID=3041267 RepID=UPI00280C898E|nr:sodium:solute symporter [Pelagicoccus sp. SDUM812003]MDQ8203030.1 sodium:solute symporter [Pelagicoccus sp. SDUM812003]